MAVRGIRGATTGDDNTWEAILPAVVELLKDLERKNKFTPDDLACAFFTVTPDLTADFAARAARLGMGWSLVPLLDATSPLVPGDPPRCIRVLLLWNTDLPASAVQTSYLKGAKDLRRRGMDEGTPGGFRGQ